MPVDRTGWPIAVITAVLLPIVIFLAYLGCDVVANLAYGQTRPVWPLPQCDDVKDSGTHACILVSEEHWGGNLPRSPVVFTCLKINNVLQSCWQGDSRDHSGSSQ